MDIDTTESFRWTRTLRISLNCKINQPHVLKEALKKLPDDIRIEDFDLTEQCTDTGNRWLTLTLSSSDPSWFQKANQPLRLSTKTHVTLE